MKTFNGVTMSDLEWLEAAQGTFIALCRGFSRPKKEKVRAAKFLIELYEGGVDIPRRYVQYAKGILS